MPKNRRNQNMVELARLWVRWSELIAKLLRKRWGLGKVNSAEYKEVHGNLMAALARATAEPATAAPLKQHDLAELREFCRTWISLDALENADRRLLQNVIKKSEELSLQHFGCKTSSRFIAHALQLVAMTSVLIILVAGTVGKSGWLAWNGSLPSAIRSEAYRTWFTIGQYSSVHWLGVATGVVVLVGIWMLSSTQRL